MNVNSSKGNKIGLLKRFLLMFASKKEENVPEISPAEIISKEIDRLWSKVRVAEDVEESSFYTDFGNEIEVSFSRLRSEYTPDLLDEVYVWPRYVKIAVHSVETPVEGLISYVQDSNYISLTKCLSDLSKHIHNGENDNIKKNIDLFSEAVYLHIVNDIKPDDIPANLALGRLLQDRGDYEGARYRYSIILETNDPYNGLTSLLACNEVEIKEVLAEKKNSKGRNLRQNERLRVLNEQQCALYDKWCGILEERQNAAGASVKERKEYVAIVTGYVRFERNRSNYDKAFALLDKIPDSSPEIYRVYSEEAMLYQFKPYNNPYYNLDKAIETFIKADRAINEAQDTVKAKSRKCILVPLANAYFQSGKYESAVEICDRVLEIDPKENRAIKLKKLIESKELYKRTA